MAHVAPVDAAEHRVRLTADHRQRRDHGRVGANQRPCGIGRDAASARHIDVALNVGAITRIIFRIDQVEILPGLDR